jgi:hypothetical protein
MVGFDHHQHAEKQLGAPALYVPQVAQGCAAIAIPRLVRFHALSVAYLQAMH